MPSTRARRLPWAVSLAFVATLAGAVGYSAGRGASLFGIHPRIARADTPSRPASPSEMPGMAGMADMPGMGQGTPTSHVPAAPLAKGYGAVTILPEIQQRIGVAIGTVVRESLTMNVRTVGIVRPDETRTVHIHVRTEGWVNRLMVNFTGQEIRKGTPMLAIYSPEFYRTQLDYVTARRSERFGAVANEEGSLAELSLRKLKLLDVSAPELEALTRTGTPQELLTLRCPVNGTVLEKSVLEQEYVTPQRDLYVVADLSSVWVQAKVYEYELPHVELGKEAEIAVPAVPNHRFTGKVVFIQPTVEETTRTVQVRVELPNPRGLLKPGMFADIVIAHPMDEGLLVPTSAIIRTGRRDIAFRVVNDRFIPVEVRVGEVTFGDHFQILEGLQAGDRIVTSANFLIDSESRLREGDAPSMAGMPGMDMGTKTPAPPPRERPSPKAEAAKDGHWPRIKP